MSNVKTFTISTRYEFYENKEKTVWLIQERQTILNVCKIVKAANDFKYCTLASSISHTMVFHRILYDHNRWICFRFKYLIKKSEQRTKPKPNYAETNNSWRAKYTMLNNVYSSNIYSYILYMMCIIHVLILINTMYILWWKTIFVLTFYCQ